MAVRRPFWKWRRWKSIGFCLWPPSTCIWSLKLKFQRKLDLCSGNHVVYRRTDGRTDRRTDGRTRWIQYTPLQLRWAGNQKFQYGRQAAILKVTSLKINRLLTINMHMKFEIEFPKETWLMLRKPCRLQTDGWTDGRTRWIQYTLRPTSLGGGITTTQVGNFDNDMFHTKLIQAPLTKFPVRCEK